MKSLRLDGIEYPVTHYPSTGDRYSVVMLDPETDAILAFLTWHEFTGEIRQVRVEVEEMRRKGIATALLKIARSISTVRITHSKTRSEDGDAWARAVLQPGEVLQPLRECQVA